MKDYIIEAITYLADGLTFEDYVEDNEDCCATFLHQAWAEAEKQANE